MALDSSGSCVFGGRYFRVPTNRKLTSTTDEATLSSPPILFPASFFRSEGQFSTTYEASRAACALSWFEGSVEEKGLT